MRLIKALIAIAISTLLASVAFAQQQTFQDWVVGSATNHSFVFAATFAGEGVGLAEYCSTSTAQCNWQLMLPIACNKGTVSPILGSTSSGAVALNVQCTGNTTDDGKDTFYQFMKWQDLEEVMKDSANVVFAFPMAGGDIKVARFSLSGRTDAMEFAESVAVQASKQHPSSGLSTPANVHL